MAYEANFTIKDGENHSSTTGVYFTDAETEADIAAFIAAAIPLIEAIIDGKVTKVTLTKTLVSALASGIDPTSDVEIAAKFIFDVFNTVKNKVITLATFTRSKLIPGTSNVNTADADVTAFVNFMVATPVAVADPTDSEERDILGLLSAKEEYTRRRRRS